MEAEEAAEAGAANPAFPDVGRVILTRTRQLAELDRASERIAALMTLGAEGVAQCLRGFDGPLQPG